MDPVKVFISGYMVGAIVAVIVCKFSEWLCSR